MKTFRLHDRIVASIQGAIHHMNVGDDSITSLLTSWENFIDDNMERAAMSFYRQINFGTWKPTNICNKKK